MPARVMIATVGQSQAHAVGVLRVMGGTYWRRRNVGPAMTFAHQGAWQPDRKSGNLMPRRHDLTQTAKQFSNAVVISCPPLHFFRYRHFFDLARCPTCVRNAHQKRTFAHVFVFMHWRRKLSGLVNRAVSDI